jgi:hypothetical protein
MHPELQKLIRHLQNDKCPPTVLDRVAQRITRDQKSARPMRALFAWALSVCLLGAIGLWQWQTHRETQRAADRALVRQQTQQAFGYIGHALIRAAAQTENALSKEAVPPLRNSFETIKNKVTNPI